MDREQKATAIAEIGENLENAEAIFAVDYRGISVPQVSELRGKLREADASFSVVKNRLAKRAAADSGTEGLDELLVGPTALTYVRGDAVLAAKAISEFIAEHEILAYKGGIMDGAPLDGDGFKAMSKLPGVDVLRGRLVGLTASPLTGIARGLGGLASGLAIALGQIAEQGLVGGDAEEAPAEEPAAEDEADAAPADDAEASGDDAAEEPAADAEADSGDEESDQSAEGGDAPEAESQTETESESDDGADAGGSDDESAESGDEDKEND